MPTDEEVRDVLTSEEAPESAAFKEFISTLPEEEREMAGRIGAAVLPLLAAQAAVQSEAKKAQELKQIVTQLTSDNKKILEAKIEEFRKALTPPSKEDIQTMLDQEYAEFTLELKNGSEKKHFILRELPLAAEARLLKVINKTLAARLGDLARLDWANSMDAMSRITQIVAMMPETMDTLADCCACCLDPFGEEAWVTQDWVKKHIGLNRLVSILTAQVTVSRYRDFFSLCSRFIQLKGIV